MLVGRGLLVDGAACDEEAIVGGPGHHDRQAHAAAAQQALSGPAARWS